MSKNNTYQRYIFKIRSSRLRKAKWNLNLPISEAKLNDELISLASSQVLRWFDELNNVEDADSRAKDIRRRIKTLRREVGSLQGRREINKLYSELDLIQFKPDYICLIIDKEKDYHRAIKGFKINGIKYERFLGTNGGVKDETIVFISSRYADIIKSRTNNGRNLDTPIVPAKLEAYKALVCSASIPVSMPRIIVVPDCEVKFKSDIIYLDDERDGEPLMEAISNYDVDLNESDGYGLMTPELAKRWSEELNLKYIMSGANTRFAWEKGMVYTIDYIDFSNKIAKSTIVKDAWGVDRDIRDYDLILTTSMVKLWDSYDSCESYMKNCIDNKYTFNIAKTCPAELESQRRLNYQFIQSYDLSDDDIDELISPTVNLIKDVLGGDYIKTTLFLKGVGLNEDNISKQENDYAKAIMINQEVLKDPYVKSSVFNMIRKRIDEAKVGALNVHGNYSIVGGDPYALCQSIFGLEVTGLLKAGEIYNKYWADINADNLACFRAPMTCHNNIRVVKVNTSEEVKYWFKYITTATLFNAWDTSCHALNGMD